MNYEIAVAVFFINIEILIKAFLEQMDFLFFSIFATPFEICGFVLIHSLAQ